MRHSRVPVQNREQRLKSGPGRKNGRRVAEPAINSIFHSKAVVSDIQVAVASGRM